MAFTHYEAVTIQTGQVPSSQANFPALVPFLAGDADFATVANGGKAQNANGYDIRPYADSALTTPLAYELVPGSYNATTGAFQMWVKMTAADAAVVYMAVGDSGISTDGSSAATWDAHHQGVWHMNDNAANTTIKDSTSNGINANTQSSGTTQNTSALSIAAEVGKGLDFSSNITNVNWAKTGNITTGNSATLEGWVKLPYGTGTTSFGRILEIGLANYYLGVNGTAEFLFLVNYPTNPVTGIHGGSLASAQTAWTHLVGTYTGGVARLYVNGSQVDTTSGWTDPGAVTDAFIFNAYSVAPDSFSAWSQQDEMRLSDIARSADWIATEYNNQSNLSAFWSKGSITAAGGGVANYEYAGNIALTAGVASPSFQNRVYAGSIPLTLAVAAKTFLNHVYGGSCPLSLAIASAIGRDYACPGSIVLTLGVNSPSTFVSNHTYAGNVALSLAVASKYSDDKPAGSAAQTLSVSHRPRRNV